MTIDWNDQAKAFERLFASAPAVEFELGWWKPRLDSGEDVASAELHIADNTATTKIYLDSDLDAFGRHYNNWGYSSVEHIIVLREWNEQVLLHELLHAIVGGIVPARAETQYPFLYEHNVVNAVEVALAPLVRFLIGPTLEEINA